MAIRLDQGRTEVRNDGGAAHGIALISEGCYHQITRNSIVLAEFAPVVEVQVRGIAI